MSTITRAPDNEGFPSHRWVRVAGRGRSVGLERSPDGGEVRSKTPIVSVIVTTVAAIVTIANVVMAAAGEPQQSWS